MSAARPRRADDAPAGPDPAGASPVDAPPDDALPRVARHAPGPWIPATRVAPSSVRFRNARTWIVRTESGDSWRAIRVVRHGRILGWWGVASFTAPVLFDLAVAFQETPDASVIVELSDGRRIALPPGSVEL